MRKVNKDACGKVLEDRDAVYEDSVCLLFRGHEKEGIDHYDPKTRTTWSDPITPPSVKMKKKFIIQCSWTVESTLIVETETQEEAEQAAYDLPTDKFPSPEYRDESFLIEEIKQE